MTKKFFITILTFSMIIFTSCLPQVSITAGKADEISLNFSTGFSQSTAKTLKSLSGAGENEALFNNEDILKLLKSSGALKTSATIPNPTEVKTSATFPEVSKTPLCVTGLVNKKDKSLSLTIGPKQIVSFYDLLNDDAKSYLDLMMIPALLGEKMTINEYRELLSSMYGPTFANEIVDGKLSIKLSSPDGKKTINETISLGELLTSDAEKTWILNF